MALYVEPPVPVCTHRNRTKRIGAMAAGCLSVLFLSMPVFADDTEVFFGQRNHSSDSDPNVLFVLDTSSSMTSKDGTGQTRLVRMKEALHTIIDSSVNVNFGLMRFNGAYGGGSVLFPVTPIDQEMCAGSCNEVDLVSKLSAGENDVEEPDSDGVVYATSSTINLTRNSGAGTEQTVGLRYENLQVPQGATITSAIMVFVAKSNQGVTTNLSIEAEQSDDSPAFSSTDYDVSSRSVGS